MHDRRPTSQLACWLCMEGHLRPSTHLPHHQLQASRYAGAGADIQQVAAGMHLHATHVQESDLGQAYAVQPET